MSATPANQRQAAYWNQNLRAPYLASPPAGTSGRGSGASGKTGRSSTGLGLEGEMLMYSEGVDKP